MLYCVLTTQILVSFHYYIFDSLYPLTYEYWSQIYFHEFDPKARETKVKINGVGLHQIKKTSARQKKLSTKHKSNQPNRQGFANDTSGRGLTSCLVLEL